MAVAMAVLYPEPAKGGRGKKNSLLNGVFSQQLLSQARTVLKAIPEVAELVLAGDKPLAEAYREVARVMMGKAPLEAEQSPEASD